MDYYAQLDANGWYLGVVGVDGGPAPGAGFQVLQGWAGWPAAPCPYMALRWVNGAQVWDDPRTLAQAQADQVNTLSAAYVAAIAAPVSFTTGAGVTQTFDADPASIDDVANMQLAFAKSQAVPTGFFWVAADNSQVPFTYGDVQGLASVLGTQGFIAFATLQSLKAQVRAATTVAAVNAIAWPAGT